MTSALATDLYQLTMMAGYVAAAVRGRSTFELFVRDLPSRRGYLVAAGIEQAIEALLNLRFDSDEIAWLRTVPALSRAPREFFDLLAALQPVEIQVCHAERPELVFLEQCVGGTAHGRGRTERDQEAAHERGLPRAELPFEADHERSAPCAVERTCQACAQLACGRGIGRGQLERCGLRHAGSRAMTSLAITPRSPPCAPTWPSVCAPSRAFPRATR